MESTFGRISPLVFNSGDPMRIRLEQVRAGSSGIEANIYSVDSVATTWRMSASLKLNDDGSAEITVPAPEGSMEMALFVGSLTVDGETAVLPIAAPSICNPSAPVASTPEAVEARYWSLMQAQKEKYELVLGNREAPHSIEYRIAHLVEGLHLTGAMRIPGVRMFGLPERPDGTDVQKLMDATSEALGWPSRVVQPSWSEAFSAGHAMSVIVCDSVFAKDVAEALRVSSVARDEILSVLALNRGAKGIPVVTLIEKIEGEGTMQGTYRLDHRKYGGNLLGGATGGEDQHHLMIQHAALRHDPLLKLCVNLYGDAIAEQSIDARYFRLWSVLETLAGARVPGGRQVDLVGGGVWPNGATTSNAAPRVYQLIVDLLGHSAGVRMSGEGLPVGPDLYDLVRCSYARRNATAHYGRFVPGDSVQCAKLWYSDAELTEPKGAGAMRWIMFLNLLVADVLHAELSKVGRTLG